MKMSNATKVAEIIVQKIQNAGTNINQIISSLDLDSREQLQYASVYINQSKRIMSTGMLIQAPSQTTSLEEKLSSITQQVNPNDITTKRMVPFMTDAEIASMKPDQKTEYEKIRKENIDYNKSIDEMSIRFLGANKITELRNSLLKSGMTNTTQIDDAIRKQVATSLSKQAENEIDITLQKAGISGDSQMATIKKDSY